MTSHPLPTLFFAFFLSASLASAASSLEEAATPTGKTENKAPAWAKPGTLVYRICTPDNPDVLDSTEMGIGMVSHLTDGSIHQIPMLNGIIGHDHLGVCNWDGVWPDWNRVTFRANNSWKYLSDFMVRVRDKYQAKPSFHVNLTDVDAGLRDYPETREFFQKLVATKSMYRRDINSVTNKRDGEPYVPKEIPADAKNPINIVALVNYKNFWDSGLAREMIDTFYGHLPFAPPILYLDVLNLSGGNFSTGFPDGPLGGSEQTQLEGVRAIGAYLLSKGTDLATEGDRQKEAGPYARYVWLHGRPGISTDDYSVISGASNKLPLQQVAGNTGCFNVSPIASTAAQLEKVRAHYTRLLAGAKDDRVMPGLDTYHISDRGGQDNEFNIAGAGGDSFRGDWTDLVNNFYLTGIQELYHIGKGNVRVAVLNGIGVLHVSKLVLVAPDGQESTLPASSMTALNAATWLSEQIKKSEHVMLERTLSTTFNAPKAGKYQVKLYGNNPGSHDASINVNVNGNVQLNVNNIRYKSRDDWQQETDLGEITVGAGDNQISIDPGPLYMKWSDGTVATWPEPAKPTGFKVTNGEVTFAEDYDRMWPDTWSGQKKIYFYSWDGTTRSWKLPQEWAKVEKAVLYPLTPDGRGAGIALPVKGGDAKPKLLPQVPYVLVPQ